MDLVKKHNLEDLPNIVKLACDLGVNEVFVQNLQSWSKESFRKTVKRKHSIFYEEQKKKEESFEKVRRIANELGVKISLPQLNDKKYTCLWPWTSCWVSVEGFITPCCNCSDPRTKHFGNIFEKPIENILKNRELEILKSKLEK